MVYKNIEAVSAHAAFRFDAQLKQIKRSR